MSLTMHHAEGWKGFFFKAAKQRIVSLAFPTGFYPAEVATQPHSSVCIELIFKEGRCSEASWGQTQILHAPITWVGTRRRNHPSQPQCGLSGTLLSFAAFCGWGSRLGQGQAAAARKFLDENLGTSPASSLSPPLGPSSCIFAWLCPRKADNTWKPRGL